ncbi:nad dependent epimerase dehydratase [Diplodia corticola]|uniref:Nad dependent epimerase dehydratase n=1 Tax=Diplodia corticola TaxID=236234 RepID=A0A1J9RN49_9PEZI|nr:nad dependent epimerase dehydratase [Diplodia corticola]OJD33987.1 nad dependent epimerase dehydratase [Diplodia corticola]
MAMIEKPAIPKGSTILVTGVNGYIGSHVADQFLQLGFRVRGTVRDTKKNEWMTELFEKTYGADRFELVAVPDIALEGAFLSAVKGVSAVIHVASNVTLDPDTSKVFPTAVDGALSALKAANSEGTVKRFVLTSSSFAASMSNTSEQTVTKDSWNESSIRTLQADPPYPPERGVQVYAASKALSERAVWRFCHEDATKRPDLVVNAVLPSANFGKILGLDHQGHASTAGFIKGLWYGTRLEWLACIPPHYFIDVQDAARLHVAATLHPAVADERIFGYAEPYNYDTLLNILRKQNPGRDFIENFQSGRDSSVVDEPRARTEELLRELGRPGFTSLEESIRANSEGLG